MYTPNAVVPSTGPQPGSSGIGDLFDSKSTLIPVVEELPPLTPSAIILDLLLMSIALLTVVFRGSLAANEHSLTEILKLRVSLANLFLAGTCIVSWKALLYLTAPSARRTPIGLRYAIDLSLQVIGCTLIVVALLLFHRPSMATAENLGIFSGGSFLFLLFRRFALAGYQALIEPAIRKDRTVVIVGCGWRGQKVAEQLHTHPKWNYHFLGYVDPAPPPSGATVIATLSTLEYVLMNNPVDEVIITLPVKSMYDEIQCAIAVCERLGIQSRYSTNLFATQITKMRSIDRHDPSSVLLHMVHTDIRRALKRLIDIAVAGIGLVVLSPLLLIIAACIKFGSPGPVLFCQQRYGLNKRLFKLYKFRSMVVDAELQQGNLEHLNETSGPAFKIRQDPRITGVGSFIRKTSLDELPQLWNVLVGDMSLVGPRPLPLRDVSRFSEAWLMRRFSVPPGITGLWQVSGRSNTSFARWIALDLDYIDRWSLSLDIKILARTLPAVLKGEGAA